MWKDLYNQLERSARKAFFAVDEEEKQLGRDILWFCGMVQILLYMAEIK